MQFRVTLRCHVTFTAGRDKPTDLSSESLIASPVTEYIDDEAAEVRYSIEVGYRWEENSACDRTVNSTV